MHDDAGSGFGPPQTASVADLVFTAVTAVPGRMGSLRRVLTEWARQLGMGTDQCESLALASYEALANATLHAYQDEGGVVDVRARYLSASAQIEITVVDHGQWRPQRSMPGGVGGRGLVLIENLAEHAEVIATASGTTVRMRWAVHS